MDWRSIDVATCPVTPAVDLVGDPWTTLVLREIMNGVRRFDDIQGHLGVSRSVLSSRLRRLLDAEVLVKREYRDPGERARHEYHLTDKGRDLQIVLHALMAFGEKWLGTPAPVVVRHDGCGQPVAPRSVCAAGHVITEPTDLHATLNEDALASAEDTSAA